MASTVKVGAKVAAQSGDKKAGKTAVKTIPGVGLMAGVGLGFWRLCRGDKEGATGEVLSGLASCFPGPGTVASLAIDGTLLVRNVCEVMTNNEDAGQV